jgi:hypothetical protein
MYPLESSVGTGPLCRQPAPPPLLLTHRHIRRTGVRDYTTLWTLWTLWRAVYPCGHCVYCVYLCLLCLLCSTLCITVYISKMYLLPYFGPLHTLIYLIIVLFTDSIRLGPVDTTRGDLILGHLLSSSSFLLSQVCRIRAIGFTACSDTLVHLANGRVLRLC